jgi:hypothetical protein
MAWLKSFFALSLYLVGACHPSEPPNGQESLSSSSPGISYPQAPCGASESLETFEMARTRQDCSWASTAPPISQKLFSLSSCSNYSGIPIPLIASPISTWEYAADPGRVRLASYTIFIPKESPIATPIGEGWKEDDETQEPQKASLGVFKAKFEELLNQRRVSPTMVTSFLEVPPFNTYSPGSTNPVVFRIVPLIAFSDTSELMIDISNSFKLPSDSTGYSCKIASLSSTCQDGSSCSNSATCTYDSDIKILSLKGFTVGSSSDTQITIQDTPTTSRSPGLIYPSTPGLYNLPIMLKYSSSYTYTGTQSILVMPSGTPTTSSISLAHTSFNTSSHLKNLATISLKPSFSTFKPNDTIEILFPLRASYGLLAFEQTLGLCRKYNPSNSDLDCLDKYSINSNDKIPCMDKTNPGISITCSIVFGNDKSYTPTVIKAQITAGTVDTLNLSFLASTPKTAQLDVAVLINVSGTYEGTSLSKTLTSYVANKQEGDFTYGYNTLSSGFNYRLSITSMNSSKVLIYLGSTMHKVPGNTPLHDDIYTDLDVLLTSGFTLGYSGDEISFGTNKVHSLLGGMNNLYSIYINSSNSITATSVLKLKYGYTPVINDSTTLFDKTNIALNSVEWVTFNIKPNYVTDIYSKITFELEGFTFMSNSCFFIDASGRSDTSVCTINSTAKMLEISEFSPYTTGSSYAINISEVNPIKIKALVKATACSGGFIFSQYSSNTATTPAEKISYNYYASICGSTATSLLNAYATVLEKAPISAVSCTEASCHNYGEIRFTINIPSLTESLADYEYMYVHTGGQLTQMVSGSKLRCEYITEYGTKPLSCQSNQDSKDFKITLSLDPYYKIDYEFIITSEGDSDGNNKGFKIPDGTADPVKIGVTIFNDATLVYTNNLEYYPPYKLLDDFSIDFFHRLADMQNKLTITAHYTEATGDEIFYLAIQTDTVKMNFNGMEDDMYDETTTLPCKFDSCPSCECYPVVSWNSIIYPFKIKVLGLDISSKKTFEIMGIHFPDFYENQRYNFYGELWSKDGKKIAESILSNYFYPAKATIDSTEISSIKLDYLYIDEGNSNYYDFIITMNSMITYSECFIQFFLNLRPEAKDFFEDRVDPATGSVAVFDYNTWVFPSSGPNGTDYVAFKMKAPPLQKINVMSATLMCFNPNSYTALKSSYDGSFSSSNGGEFMFKTGDSITVTSVYGKFISNAKNLAIIQYSVPGSDFYWTNIYVIRIIFSQEMNDFAENFEEILGLSSLPQYSVRKFDAKTIDFLFNSPIEIRSSIKIIFTCIPLSSFTVTMNFYADRSEPIDNMRQLYLIKRSITSDTVEISLGTQSEDIYISTPMQPGSTTSNFTFTLYITTSSNLLFDIQFPEPNYGFVTDLRDIGDWSISCNGQNVCAIKNVSSDTISIDTKPSGMLSEITLSGSGQNIKIQRGMLVYILKLQTDSRYQLQRYDSKFTSITSRLTGALGCASLFEINANFGVSILPGDVIRFYDDKYLYHDSINLSVLFKSDTKVLEFGCVTLFEATNNRLSSFDCYYRGTDSISSSSLSILATLNIGNSLPKYRISLVRRTLNGNYFLATERLNDISGNCFNNDLNLNNLEELPTTGRKTVSYNLPESYAVGSSYFVLIHGKYFSNISVDPNSDLEIVHSFDLDRTIFKPKAGSSSISAFGISFDLAEYDYEVNLKMYAYNVNTFSKKYILSYNLQTQDFEYIVVKKDGSSTLVSNPGECYSIDIDIMFQTIRRDGLNLGVYGMDIIYADDIMVYRVDGSSEISVNDFSAVVAELYLNLYLNFVNNVLYRIKNIKICNANNDFDIILFVNSMFNHKNADRQMFTFNKDTGNRSLGYKSLKWLSVSTPYQTTESSSVNSIHFKAMLPNMPSTYSTMIGKISLTFTSGATLVEDRYYMLFSKYDRPTNLTSYRCDKKSATEIECSSPFTGSDYTTWGNGSHIISIGSPTMNKIAFSNLSSTLKVKAKLSTTWTPNSASTIYDYESYFTYFSKKIPSAKFEYIYKPTASNKDAIGSIYIQTPEQISVGSELTIKFPICDDLQGNIKVGVENPFRSAKEDNACTVYSSNLINTTCKSYSGLYISNIYECLNTPAYLKITFKESVPISTTLEIFLGQIEKMGTYLSSGITATLIIGSNTYSTTIYENTNLSHSSLSTTTQDLNYPSTLKTNGPVSLTVPLPSNYNLSKKGYIFFSTTTTSDYIKINDDSIITAPAGKYLPPYNIGILPSSVSGNSTNITLRNVGPFSDSIADFTSEDYLKAQVYTDGSLVGDYTYKALPSGSTKPTISVSSFSTTQADYIGDPKASIQPNNLYQFTIQISMDMWSGSSILLTIPSGYHDNNFSTSPLCYLSENSLSLSGCYTSKDSNNNHVMTAYALGEVLQGSTITFNVRLINAPISLSTIAASHKYNDKSIEVASFSDVKIQLACTSTQYLSHINTCVDDCTAFDGYYGSTQPPLKCFACITNCKDCSNGSSCDLCNSGYLRSKDSNNNYLCATSCSTGYYADNTSPATCKPCDSICETCTESGKCTKCKDNKYLHNENTECVASCPAKYYGQDTSPKKCIGCATNCNSCNSTTCLQCDTNFYLYGTNKECISECKAEDKKYISLLSPLTCSNCMADCDNCTNGSTCEACTNPYVLKADKSSCLVSCPAQYYPDSNRVCTSCLSNCKTCTDGSSCQECIGNFYLFDDGNSCVSSCDTSQGYFITSNSKSCNPCSDDCMTCNNESECTECDANFYLHNDGCVSECPDEFYTDDSNKPSCKACLSNCKTCSNSSVCNECLAEFYLHDDDKQCVSSCPYEYYPFVDAGSFIASCENCLDNCKDCDDNTLCQTCKDGYLLFEDDSLCILRDSCQVDNGYFIDEDLQACLPCLADCKKCTNTTKCDECNDNIYLINDNTSCVSSCPDEGYYEDTSSVLTCSLCLENCKTCDTDALCFECITDNYLHNLGTQCLNECPDGYYDGTESGVPTCISCADTLANCAKCSNPLTCDECEIDYFMVEDTLQCVETCPADYYTVLAPSKSCSACIDDCKSCESATECTICYEGYTYLTNPPLCFKNCEDGYYRDDRTCVNCRDDCKTCENGNECLECVDLLYLHMTDNQKKCISECPSFYYEDDSIPASCKSCLENCKECSNSTECVECVSGYYLDSDGLCKICPEKCVDCTLQDGNLICTSCAEGYYKYQNDCLDTCPDGLYEVDTTQTCESCPSGSYKDSEGCSACPNLCKECISNLICTYCIENASLKNNETCECNDNYIEEQSTCERKRVTWEMEYSELDRTITISLSAPLTIPLTKDNIIIEITRNISNRSKKNRNQNIREILSPDFYTLTSNQDGMEYTILFNDDLVGVSSFEIKIVNPNNLMDFDGNLLYEGEYQITLDTPDEPEEDDDDDDDDDSNYGLIKVVCPILMVICAIILLIGFFASRKLYIWQGINFLQILSYVYLIDLEWPDTIADFLPGILYYNYFPNIFHLIEKDGPSPFSNAEDFDYDTSQFLRNNGVIITFFVAVIIVWPMVFLTSKVVAGKPDKISKALRRLCSSYNWNSYLRVYIETYLVVAIVCLLQLKYSDYDNANLVINFISALIAIVIFT